MENIKSKRKIMLAIVSILVLFAILAGSVAPVAAATKDVRATYSGSFTSKWKRSKTDTGNNTTFIQKLVYGYNTLAINEDYAWATVSAVNRGNTHRAILKNANGTHYGPKVESAYKSEIEVRHKGSSITYINRRDY